MKEIRIAVLGMGFIGKVHAYAYTALPFFYRDLPYRISLKAVYNRSLAAAQDAKEHYGFETATDDMEAVFRRKDIDVVSVCLPNCLHAEAVEKAAKRGWHIYCEKPLAADAQEAQRMVKAVEGRDIRHQVVFHNRYFACVMRAKQLIEEGRLGRIMNFQVSYQHPSNVDASRRYDWKFDKAVACGGVLVDMGSHALDLLYNLIGPYSEVQARMQIAHPVRRDAEGREHRVEVEDAAYIIAEMENGAQGTIHVSKIATGTNDEFRVEIFGDRGAIRFNLMDPNWVEFYDNTLPDEALGGTKGFMRIESVQRYGAPGGSFPSSKLPGGWLRAHVHSMYTFMDCVYSGRPCSPDFADGATIQRVMDAAYESDRTGIRIKV